MVKKQNRPQYHSMMIMRGRAATQQHNNQSGEDINQQQRSSSSRVNNTSTNRSNDRTNKRRQRNATNTMTTTIIPDPREPNNLPPTTINPDLAARERSERANTLFNPLSITHFLDENDPSITTRHRQLESWIIGDPTGIFSNEDNNYLHRTERHTRLLAKFVRLVELCPRAAGVAAPGTSLLYQPI